MNKIKWTIDDVDKAFTEMIESKPEQKPKVTPNIIQLLRAKKEQGKTEWPLT